MNPEIWIGVCTPKSCLVRRKKYGYSNSCHVDLDLLGPISIYCDNKMRFCYTEVNIFTEGNNCKAVSLVSNHARDFIFSETKEKLTDPGVEYCHLAIA